MVVAAAQRMQVSRRVDDDLATHEPRDPFGNGRFEGQQVSLLIGFSVAWYVSLPADGGEHEAVFHQQTVAEVCFFRRRVAAGGALKGAQHAVAAAIDDVVEQRTVAARRVGGHQQPDVGAAFDVPVGVRPSQRQVDDARIGRVCRVQAELSAAEALLVWADIAEGPSIKDGAA